MPKPQTLAKFAEQALDDFFRVNKLLRKVYWAIKSHELMENTADSPDIKELTSEIGKEIGAE